MLPAYQEDLKYQYKRSYNSNVARAADEKKASWYGQLISINENIIHRNDDCRENIYSEIRKLLT